MKSQPSLLLGSLLLCSASLFAQKEQRPNIVFILCDDMGYGDLACYGQPYISTPHIDRMAAEGMRFTQAYAGSPVSAPSRATLMTGQHSGHCLVRGNKEYWTESPVVMYGENKDYSVVGQMPYDPQHIILPEIMKKNGYTTGMFGKWAGGYEGSVSTPDKRGIDEYYGYICQFQAHLYYPNFLNRYSKALGDTAVVREVMEENIQYPMFGRDYYKRPQYSADIIHSDAIITNVRNTLPTLFIAKLWSGSTDRTASSLSWEFSPIHCLMPNWCSPMTLFCKDIKRSSLWTKLGVGRKEAATMPRYIRMPSLQL